MRSESVGLVEVRRWDPIAEVAPAAVTEAEENQPSFLRASSSNSDQGGQRRTSDIFSDIWSTMASWRSDRPKSAYIPISGDADDLEDTAEGNGIQMTRLRPRIKWTWHTYVFGLALVAIFILVGDIGETIAHHMLSQRSTSDGDPFVNWGKPGTGTEDLAWYPTDFLRDVLPIPCHSHNDYWRKVPLFSAINAGCTGVEADVWLRNGDLLVGHDTASLQPKRTFQSLYVDPLVDILTRHNPTTEFYTGTKNGVFDTEPAQTLVLLVDLKTDGHETWPWVMKQLTPLRERGWLSYSEDGEFHQGPVTVVGTGNTPFDQIVVGNATYRDAFFDAPLDKLENSGFNATNSYYASVDFWSVIGPVWWKRGPGKDQLDKIRSHIREAQNRGLKARYWGLPSWPIHVRNRVWEVLVEEGIAMLNVDDLDAAAKEDWTKPGTF
ncbi:hypothetical protein C8A00DRAFT_18344 [Chaetomidium leptoderma]|uniref:Altered inheritance of mitochondria protein 6 n=1 Tax=Chaetomidium leptoderma TaxID=669021 RepID=A0AAN6VER9_9PEZI|nr:hypothetical protein C8A00DRAFT_18344 [Chaetomidium leptoderma]